MQVVNVASFSDRLAGALRRSGTPAMVGLDPRKESLPPALQPSDASPETVAAAYTRFCCEVIDVVAGLVGIVKPQAAFFEELGPSGMVALGKVIEHARSAGLLVLLDGKRNDIGSTAEAYAQGWLSPSEAGGWGADALTISPYLGDDSLTPFVDAAKKYGAGVFSLVKTSNPGGKTFQDLSIEGRPLYRHVAELVERLAQETAGTNGYGAIGGVVGATYPAQLEELREAMPHTWLLVPGYGSQGGTAADVRCAFDAQGLGAVINNSRGIIFAHTRKPYAERYGAAAWQQAVEAATRDMIAELAAETTAGRLQG